MGHLSQAIKTLAAAALYKRGARKDTVMSLTGILSGPKLSSIRSEIKDKIHYGSQNRSVEHLLQKSRLTHLHASAFLNLYLQLFHEQPERAEWEILCDAVDIYSSLCEGSEQLLDINECFFLTKEYISKALLIGTCDCCQSRFVYLFIDDAQQPSPGCPSCATLKLRSRKPRGKGRRRGNMAEPARPRGRPKKVVEQIRTPTVTIHANF